jgi:hypothetical protein
MTWALGMYYNKLTFSPVLDKMIATVLVLGI